MERIGSGAYASVYGHKNRAFKIPQKWSTSEIHTVIREGLLLRLGYGPALEGLCAEKIYSLVNAPKRFYGFAMPRAMCTLDRWQTTNDFDSLQRIMLQVASQLRKLHVSGLVHADIKPKNILIFENGDAKLCDFGLATHAGTSGTECYTINYRPPEHLEASRSIEFSSDIWALGITFYDILFGLASMGLTSPKEVLAKTIEDIPREDLEQAIKQKFLCQYARTSSFFESVLSKCLAYDPSCRPDIQFIEIFCDIKTVVPGIKLNLKTPYKSVPMDFDIIEIASDCASSSASGSASGASDIASCRSTSPICPLARPIKVRNMDSFYSICKSICSVVQVDQTLIEPHALKLVTLLKKHLDMRLTLACAVSVSFCIYLIRTSRVLRHDVCSRIAECSVSCYDTAMKEALMIGLQWPEWSIGLLIKTRCEV